MSRIRVLVVDDAVVFRKAIGDAVAGDSELELVGTAPNGSIALSKIPQLNPDVVTLDVEMPELDGIGTLTEIRKRWPKLPVIMVSAHTAEGAAVTLRALELGANDFVTKPTGMGSITAAMEALRRDLVPKVKALAWGHTTGSASKLRPAIAHASSPAAHAPMPPAMPVLVNRPPVSPGRRLDLLAIGCSTGGPNALAELIPLLPKDLPVPVVIVQHMPPMFTKLLAERLGQKSAIAVHEGVDGKMLKPGECWIAPGGQHMVVVRQGENLVLRLNQDPPENSCRPAVDPLFRSIAATGVTTLAVVLTGMGEDGLRGGTLLVEKGNPLIAQDQATSVVWGMPGAVVKHKVAEGAYPLAQIAGEIVRRLKAGRIAWMGAVRSAS